MSQRETAPYELAAHRNTLLCAPALSISIFSIVSQSEQTRCIAEKTPGAVRPTGVPEVIPHVRFIFVEVTRRSLYAPRFFVCLMHGGGREIAKLEQTVSVLPRALVYFLLSGRIAKAAQSNGTIDEHGHRWKPSGVDKYEKCLLT